MCSAICCTTGYGLGVGFSAAMGTYFVSDAMPYKLLDFTLVFSACAVTLVGIVAAGLSAQRVFRLEAGVVFRA